MKSGEKRLFLAILVVALFLTLVALFPVWQQQRRVAQMAVQQVAASRGEILGDARHARGPANAPFVLVEFADFTCAHCSDAAPYVDELVRKHPRDLQHIFRCFPIERHMTARLCAMAAEAAALQGRFWEMESRLFASRGQKSEEEIDRIAMATGLDMSRYRKDVQSARLNALVEQDERAASALGITTTPTFFFISPHNTYRIRGGEYLERFLADDSHWR